MFLLGATASLATGNSGRAGSVCLEQCPHRTTFAVVENSWRARDRDGVVSKAELPATEWVGFPVAKYVYCQAGPTHATLDLKSSP